MWKLLLLPPLLLLLADDPIETDEFAVVLAVIT